MEILISGCSVDIADHYSSIDPCGYDTLPGCGSYCNCDCNGDH